MRAFSLEFSARQKKLPSCRSLCHPDTQRQPKTSATHSRRSGSEASIQGGNMRVRRTFSLGGFAAATVTALALSGCVPGSSTSGTTPVAVPSIDPASLAGQTLDYMYFTDGPDLQATKAIIADFEKKYSVKVNIE